MAGSPAMSPSTVERHVGARGRGTAPPARAGRPRPAAARCGPRRRPRGASRPQCAPRPGTRGRAVRPRPGRAPASAGSCSTASRALCTCSRLTVRVWRDDVVQLAGDPVALLRPGLLGQARLGQPAAAASRSRSCRISRLNATVRVVPASQAPQPGSGWPHSHSDANRQHRAGPVGQALAAGADQHAPRGQQAHGEPADVARHAVARAPRSRRWRPRRRAAPAASPARAARPRRPPRRPPAAAAAALGLSRTTPAAVTAANTTMAAQRARPGRYSADPAGSRSPLMLRSLRPPRRRAAERP